MRVQFIDIARGLCILMVVWGHNPQFVDTPLNTVMGAVRMPLMFFIAGSFMSPTRDWTRLAIDKADALLKPFLLMALLQAPFRIGLSGASPQGYALATLSGSGNYLPWMYVFWFLTHLWWVFMAGNALVVWLKFDQWQRSWQAMALAASLWLGTLILPVFWHPDQMIPGTSVGLQGLPFSLDLLPITTAFFMLGLACRQWLRQWRFQWGTLVLSMLVIAACQWSEFNTMRLLERHVTHVVWSTATALAGICLVITVAAGLTRWSWLDKGLSLCGRNSLFILLFHSQLQSISQRLWTHALPTQPWLSATLGWASCIVMCLLLAGLMRRHFWSAALWLPVKNLRREQAGQVGPAQETLATQLKGA